MGLLDDLKKQADLVKTQQIHQQNLQGDKLKIVEEKMKQTFQYVHELLNEHRAELDALAEALLARETLDEDEVYAVVGVVRPAEPPVAERAATQA